MAKKAVVSKKKTVVINQSSKYESGAEDFFVNSLPSLPKGLKEFIVNIGPWGVLVSLLLTLPAVLTLFGLGTMMAPFGYMMRARWMYGFSLSWILVIATFGLNAWALPGLFKRQMSAWRLMLYSLLISAVGSLLTGEIISFIVGTGLSLYILYQVKSYYK